MGCRRSQWRDPRDARRAGPRGRLTLDPATAAFGALGALWGLGADRLATRWPAHDVEGIRRPDWRTVMVASFGLATGALLPLRWSEPRELALVGAYLAVLVVLLATDLDQRVLPDLLTLPLIAAALAALVLGWDPLLAGRALALVSGLAAGIGFPLFFLVGSLLFRGGLGLGDVKLLAGVGLFSGVEALLRGLIVATLGFGALLIVLMVLGRVTLRSYVPFGPVIIAAGAIAALAG